MWEILRQLFFLQSPPITETNCPDQSSRVFLVTGGYGGVGYELCKILYKHNATIFIAGRDRSKGLDAILKIKNDAPKSTGSLEFLLMDLSNLSTIKPAVDSFLAQQSRLDVLVNNAGVMFKGNNESDHNDITITTNCVAPCLLYNLLLPTLKETAKTSPTACVRVLWAGSIAVHVQCPKPGGMFLEDDGRPRDGDEETSYGQSKVGNIFLARNYAKDTPETGVVHVAFNPGNLSSGLQRYWHGIDVWLLKLFLLYPPIHGAYTELWAALAPDLTPARSGSYVYPWGCFGSIPVGIEESMKEPGEGGTGMAGKFVTWCGNRASSYV